MKNDKLLWTKNKKGLAAHLVGNKHHIGGIKTLSVLNFI